MADYFRNAIEPGTRKRIISEALKRLRPLEPDTIVCRGVSGQSVGAILAYELDCDLYVIRKPGENSHNGSSLASGHLGERCIVVDDFIASGATMVEILRHTGRDCISRIYLYNHSSGYGDEFQGVPIIRGPHVEKLEKRPNAR